MCKPANHGHYQRDGYAVRFMKTARSGALRGDLIEGHTGAGITRMPIVDRSDVRLTETAATTRQGQSAAPFSGLPKGSRREMPSLRTSEPAIA